MEKQSIFQIVKSVFAAFIGVQSNKNRQADFEQGSMKHFIITGIVFTALFVAAVIFVVSMVLSK